jgi:6-phosphogluconate dehydrogenase
MVAMAGEYRAGRLGPVNGTDQPSTVGLIGLAVMGQNLALNLAERGYPVSVFNRTPAVTEQFLDAAGGLPVRGTSSVAQLVESLARPRRIILMVKAGDPVDELLGQLLPVLDPGDVVIDGGNSRYTDTERRITEAAEAGVLFVGAGISGGEEGARHGPSIMPGGAEAAWPVIGEMLQSIAAISPSGQPCCDWVGSGGSGHYVKMIHNGIEYGDMQIIAEAYHLLQAAGMTAPEMAQVFRGFSAGRLSSFLIDITADILERRDDDGTPLVEKILDAAAQKGTGQWTVHSSLDLGQPTTLIAEAVYARTLSSMKELRMEAARTLGGDGPTLELAVADLENALYASKLVSYAQGFMLLEAASEAHGWELDLAEIAPLWRAGCIIRAAFLDDITAAFRRRGDAQLLLDEFFAGALRDALPGWRRVVAAAVAAGVPVPAYSSALAFFDGYRSERLPANLIQAQRDYFGAHTYERTDHPRGEHFHTDWTAR